MGLNPERRKPGEPRPDGGGEGPQTPQDPFWRVNLLLLDLEDRLVFACLPEPVYGTAVALSLRLPIPDPKSAQTSRADYAAALQTRPEFLLALRALSGSDLRLSLNSPDMDPESRTLALDALTGLCATILGHRIHSSDLSERLPLLHGLGGPLLEEFRTQLRSLGQLLP